MLHHKLFFFGKDITMLLFLPLAYYNKQTTINCFDTFVTVLAAAWCLFSFHHSFAACSSAFALLINKKKKSTCCVVGILPFY